MDRIFFFFHLLGLNASEIGNSGNSLHYGNHHINGIVNGKFSLYIARNYVIYNDDAICIIYIFYLDLNLQKKNLRL